MRIAIIVGLVAGTVASVLLAAPARATNGTPCSWTVTTPKTYSIGAATPKVKVTGSCVTTPSTSFTGPDNWKLYVDLLVGGRVVSGASMLFQGCDWQYRGGSDQAGLGRCNSVAASNGAFPVVTTVPLRITTAGTFTTSATSRSYAYNLGDTFGYVTTFTPATVTAKFATVSAVKATRSGTLRKFTVYPRHYQVGRGFVGSTRTAVQLQRYVNHRWTTYRTLSSTRYPFTWSARFSKVYYWRVVTPATSTRWASTSKSIKV